MKTLPELNNDAIIELAREGGFAFIPKLAGPRRFALASVPPSERERICNAIRDAFPQARESGEPDGPGRGDQFYYRIHISYSHPQQNQYADVILLIPEDRAPPELTELWRNGIQA
ncbi:protealysin inhibitor emfourin [Pectobacterium punjabense]|uniref:protealysin inhibitor emfourin n=1 Tax=Pectobacterium punjabense TaxID=2108399 RepID=UPI002B242B36|nr:protealysin inhibitor emfourin [Pectobacterium punjabense]